MAKKNAGHAYDYPYRTLKFLQKHGFMPVSDGTVHGSPPNRTKVTVDARVYRAIEDFFGDHPNRCWVRITSVKDNCSAFVTCRSIRYVYDDDFNIINAECDLPGNRCNDGSVCNPTHDPTLGLWACTCPEDGIRRRQAAKKAQAKNKPAKKAQAKKQPAKKASKKKA